MLAWFQPAGCPLQIKYLTVTELGELFININEKH